jgi:L-fuconolactonase
MLKIDAHQHFWIYDSVRDAWITDDMQPIKRDFLPKDIEPVLIENGMDGCVVVQSDQTDEENFFQLNNALENDFVLGVVGWVDLQATDIHQQLSSLSQYKKLKGFRHILQGEKDRALMLTKKFMNGISALSQYHFSYDILIFPDQLQYARQLAEKFPHQKFVINHIAKPYIKDKKIDGWKQEIQSFSTLENVFCKISGMVTEADWNNWKQLDFEPYLDTVTEIFGMKRLMFGSDWPVCLVSCSYKKMKSIVDAYFKPFSETEKDDFYGGNAMRFYDLEN